MQANYLHSIFSYRGVKMKKSKKLTENQQQYKKERRRIQQALRRLHNRGYRFFSEDIIPSVEDFIEKPKRVTKKFLERLKELTPKSLASKADFYTDKGEKLTGKQGLKYEKEQKKKARQQKSEPVVQEPIEPVEPVEPVQEYKVNFTKQPKTFEDYSQTIIDSFLNDYKFTFGSTVMPLLQEWIDRLSGDIGINAVADLLQKGISNDELIRTVERYNLSSALSFISSTMDYLDVPHELKEQIMVEMNSYADDLYHKLKADGYDLIKRR